jgi:hypothetical protein
MGVADADAAAVADPIADAVAAADAVAVPDAVAVAVVAASTSAEDGDALEHARSDGPRKPRPRKKARWRTGTESDYDGGPAPGK